MTGPACLLNAFRLPTDWLLTAYCLPDTLRLAPKRVRSGSEGDFRPSGIDLGASEGWILVLFRCSFVQVGRLARRRAEPHFDSVWASRIEVRRFRAQVKIRWKNSSENAS